MSKIDLTRYLLSCCLFCLFVWQTVFSVQKYLERATSTTIQMENVKVEEFPDLSFCPMFNFLDVGEIDIDAIFADNTTFEEEYNNHMVTEESIIEYSHYTNRNIRLDMSSLPDTWAKTFAVTPQGYLAECLTYSTDMKVPLGYSSKISLHFNVKNTKKYPTVYVNPRGNNMLVATNFFGSDIVKLPMVPKDSMLYVQYKIDVRERSSLSKPDLPCHKDNDHYKMQDCLEEHFQSSMNCSLPWREQDDSGGKGRKCQTTEDLRWFKTFYLGLVTMSQQDVYEKTGCYNSCTHKVYKFEVVMTDYAERNENDTSNFNLWTWIFLAPGGLILEKEILVYDFYDLVGNVGGFLGLFLGVSLLSIYDGAHDSWLKLKRK